MTIKEMSVWGVRPLIDLKCLTCNPEEPIFQVDSTTQALINVARKLAEDHNKETGDNHKILLAIVKKAGK